MHAGRNGPLGERGPKQKTREGGDPRGETSSIVSRKGSHGNTIYSIQKLIEEIYYTKLKRRELLHFLLGKKRYVTSLLLNNLFFGTPVCSKKNGLASRPLSCYASPKIIRRRIREAKNEIFVLKISEKGWE